MRNSLEPKAVVQIVIDKGREKYNANQNKAGSREHAAIVGQEPPDTVQETRSEPVHDASQCADLNATVPKRRAGHAEEHPMKAKADAP